MKRFFQCLAPFSGMFAAIIFDLVTFWHHRIPYLTGDAVHYNAMAIRLITDHVFGYWSNAPSASVMPGYPIFLAIIYKISGLGYRKFEILWIIQLMLYISCVLLTYSVAKKLTNYKISTAITITISIIPGLFLEPFAVLTENLSIPFFLLSLYIIFWLLDDTDDKIRWVLCGLSLGLAVLARPQLAVMGLIPFYIALGKKPLRKKLSTLSIFLGACIILLTPWWIRNLITLHQVILFSNGEAANTILAGTYPGYVTGPPGVFSNVAGVNQGQLALERIKLGFEHHFFSYLAWFTVYRYHYSFDFIYWPFWTNTFTPIKPAFNWISRVFSLVGLIIMFVCITKPLTNNKLKIMAYINMVFLLAMIPFHASPRFSLPTLIGFIIIALAGSVEALNTKR